ncbi:Ankyrin repeat-containing domain [Trinorchestia longiramus]|nr:Ankyrin repeat-containing domain [Trinorchestia longiramus]
MFRLSGGKYTLICCTISKPHLIPHDSIINPTVVPILSTDSTGDTEMATLAGSKFASYFRLSTIATDLPKASLLEAVENANADHLRTLIKASLPNDCNKNIQKNLLLHKAVCLNNQEIVNILLDVIDAETLFLKNAEGKTALHCAVENKNIHCSCSLMHANPNSLAQKDSDGNTPLHCIVKSHQYDICSFAMQHLTEGVINMKNAQHLTAVHIAAREKRDDILRLLLENGGNPDVKTHRSFSPLHLAADSGSEQCVQLLLSYVPEQQKLSYLNYTTGLNFTALMIAATKGFSACCRALIGTNPNQADKDHFTAMHLAAKKGYLSIVQHLIEDQNADPYVVAKNGQTPLHCSILSNNDGCFTYLLDRSIDFLLPKVVQDLLKLATKKNSYSCLNIMLSRPNFASYINHQFPEENNNTLLHLSTAKGSHKTTQMLLEKKALKHIKNDDDEYPLHLIAIQASASSRTQEKERVAVCRELLQASHEIVDAPNKKGETSLHLAAKSGNLEMIRPLLCKAPKILRQDNQGLTAVHMAAKAGHDICLKKLLRALRPAEMKDLIKIQPLPLHLAAENGRIECCQTILTELKIDGSSKKSLTLRDDDNLYAIDKALKDKHYDVFRFLLHAMDLRDYDESFACRLHRYFKEKIKIGETELLVAVIESSWCEVVLNGSYCSNIRLPLSNCNKGVNIHDVVEPCDSFALLIKEYPGLACRAMDKHISVSPNLTDEIHNYTPFEYIYYYVENGHVKSPFIPVFPSSTNLSNVSTTGTTIVPQNPTTPVTPSSLSPSSPPLGITVRHPLSFDAGSRTPNLNSSSNTIVEEGPPRGIKSHAKVFKNKDWGRDHPLQRAVDGGNSDVLNHKLTRSWLQNKYNSYARWVLYTYVFIDFLTLFALSVLQAQLWNTHHLENEFSGATYDQIATIYGSYNVPYNSTVEVIQEEVLQISASDDNCSTWGNSTNLVDDGGPYPSGSAIWNRSICAIYHLHQHTPFVITMETIVSLLFLTHLILEIVFLLRLPSCYCTSFSATRIVKLFALVVMIIPVAYCDLTLGCREEILWQFGVMAVLFGWLNFVGTINKVPSMSIFMPVSRKFFASYLLVIFHIFLFIFAFALSFHFLLMDNAAFSSFPRSIIKTLVWMLGDLGYDDTFLDDETPIVYEIQANVLFVFFVTVIGGLAFNLIIRNPTDELQEIKDRADFHRAEAHLKLHLLIDDCLPGWRRKYARSHRVISSFNSKVSVFYTDCCHRDAKACKNVDDHKDEDENDLSEIKNDLKLLMERLEAQREDLTDLSRKMSALSKNLPATF